MSVAEYLGVAVGLALAVLAVTILISVTLVVISATMKTLRENRRSR